MAKSSSLGDVVVNLEARDVSLTRGLNNVNQQLNKTASSLKQFNTLSTMAFGAGAGVMAFSAIHRGLGNLTGGFAEAQQAGLGLFDSLDEGMHRITGIESRLQAAKRATDAWRESHKKLVDQLKAGNAAMDRATGKTPAGPTFPNIPDPQAGDEVKSLLEQRVKDAREAAAGARDEIAKAAAGEAQLADLQSNVLTRGGANLLQQMPAWSGLKLVDKTSEELKHMHRGVLGDLAIAEQELSDYMAELDRLNKGHADAKRNMFELGEAAAKAMRQATNEAAKMQKTAADAFAPLANIASTLGSGVGGLMGSVTKGAGDDVARDKRAAELLDTLNPYRQLEKSAAEIESLFRANKLTEQQRDELLGNLIPQSDQPQANQRSQMLGFEDLARNIQTGIGGDDRMKQLAEKQLDEQKKMRTVLEKIKSSPNPSVFQ